MVKVAHKVCEERRSGAAQVRERIVIFRQREYIVVEVPVPFMESEELANSEQAFAKEDEMWYDCEETQVLGTPRSGGGCSAASLEETGEEAQASEDADAMSANTVLSYTRPITRKFCVATGTHV